MPVPEPTAAVTNNLLTIEGQDSPGLAARLSRRAVLSLGAAACAMPAWTAPAVAVGRFPWMPSGGAVESLAQRFAPPPGFERLAVASGSFGAWLRELPMQEPNTAVHLYTGAEKARQDVHAGVIAIDTGDRDLQQCADAVMRLRAEWLFASNRADEIAFNVMGGGRVRFSRWAAGERPSPSGKSWKPKARRDASYASLRKYLEFVFAYGGTLSLEQELATVADANDLVPGDVFIKGGSPGHAVIVADVAFHATTKARRFLLVQSYMPAQEMHVLRNPANPDGSPWYTVPSGQLVTPEWTFPSGSLRRWPGD